MMTSYFKTNAVLKSYGIFRTLSTSHSPRSTRRMKALLVDGNNFLYTWYDPSCDLRRPSDGAYYGATKGFCEKLRLLIARTAATHLLVCFDSKSSSSAAVGKASVVKNVRKIADQNYKIDRPRTPERLRGQFTLCQELLKEIYGPSCVLSQQGIEADDLLASYATNLQQEYEADVTLVSNDLDFLQLVTDGNGSENATGGTIAVCRPAQRNRKMREKQVFKRFGVSPKILADFRSLLWTKASTEGKIFLPKFSTVQVKELLSEFKSIPNLLHNVEKIEDESLQQSLKESISAIELSKMQHTLMTHLQLPNPVSELALTSERLDNAQATAESFFEQEDSTLLQSVNY